ncbi:isocyanide synthase family protein [Streptomyces lavenduligriseus]|uniref:Isocyanide synthase family protein n=1 Tax=Streptomyces lavenduligriseus TaxID=67315 RepID=A0ABT0NM07_9ACTN|nr:isocyanide synthase family protein [Streptomyces lavenduligriseus]MCL3992489.1 isocyanide synthase family protein [Streptomyces lavenduligriseus]
MGLLDRYRRIDETLAAGDPQDAPGGEDGADTAAGAGCADVHRERIERFVERRAPIHFVIPAFPAKSPNRSKVLGALPDLGEHLALGFLQSLCDYIGHFYEPGARITICSDGHVFGDVVGVTDHAVTAYRQALAEMIEESGFSSLDLYGLDDAFCTTDYPKLRRLLEENYCAPLAELREKVRNDRTTQALFNGIHRFMFEDAVARRGDQATRSQLRKDSKETAYQTILRSNAWSRVVAEKFPQAVRLSIHPQAPDSEKLGLRLLRTKDGWLTPWHGVVLDDGVNRYLVRRWDAEKVHGSVVWRNGRPSHFVAPHLSVTA